MPEYRAVIAAMRAQEGDTDEEQNLDDEEEFVDNCLSLLLFIYIFNLFSTLQLM